MAADDPSCATVAEGFWVTTGTEALDPVLEGADDVDLAGEVPWQVQEY